MKPSDPRWQQRRWQTYYQSRSDYINYLYKSIRWHKKMILMYDDTGKRLATYSNHFATMIKFEKEQLKMYQLELRKVVLG